MKQQVTGLFRDRVEAGRILADHLSIYRNHTKTLILGLPRGGVPVAFEVAAALQVPLDIFMVRKLGAPHHRELAIGAIASGGVRIINFPVARHLGLSNAIIDASTASERAELERREQSYRGGRAMRKIEGMTVILVDDGLATGSTMRAAVAALQRHNPEKIVAAAPVGAAEACEVLRDEVDELVCPQIPEAFTAVGRFYRDFSPVMDREIHDLLEHAELEVMAR